MWKTGSTLIIYKVRNCCLFIQLMKAKTLRINISAVSRRKNIVLGRYVDVAVGLGLCLIKLYKLCCPPTQFRCAGTSFSLKCCLKLKIQLPFCYSSGFFFQQDLILSLAALHVHNIKRRERPGFSLGLFLTFLCLSSLFK